MIADEVSIFFLQPLILKVIVQKEKFLTTP